MAGPINPYDAPPPERRGMSGTSKALLALGIGCGVLLLLCCGVFGLSGIAMMRFAKNSTITEAPRIREISDEIATIKVPESLEPKMGLDVKMPFVGTPIMKGSAYINDSEKSYVIIGELNPEYADQSGNVKTHFTEEMKKQEGAGADKYEVVETETIDVTINNEPAKFTLAKLVHKDDAEKGQWRVEGQFQGKSGPALLFMQLESPEFSKEQALEVIHSME
ncbi:MAG: hypothetical protein AB7O59_09955 [Pirellulales bacterium]